MIRLGISLWILFLCKKGGFMAQLIVTVEDNKLLPLIRKAVSLLRGVTHVAVWSEKKGAPEAMDKLQGIPDDIKELVGIASGISKEDLEADDRLSYLLGK